MLGTHPDLRSENTERPPSRPEAPKPNPTPYPTPTSTYNNTSDRLVPDQQPATTQLSIPNNDGDLRLLSGKPRDHLVHDHVPTQLLPPRNNSRLPLERQPTSVLTSRAYSQQSNDDQPNSNNSTSAADSNQLPSDHHGKPQQNPSLLPSVDSFGLL